jgi:hypothetical protein
MSKGNNSKQQHQHTKYSTFSQSEEDGHFFNLFFNGSFLIFSQASFDLSSLCSRLHSALSEHGG